MRIGVELGGSSPECCSEGGGAPRRGDAEAELVSRTRSPVMCGPVLSGGPDVEAEVATMRAALRTLRVKDDRIEKYGR